MNESVVLDITRQSMLVCLMVSMPLLAMCLFLGLAISVFQAVTQVQEMTLTYVPKLVGAAIVVALMGNWMLQTLVQFMILCFEQVARISA